MLPPERRHLSWVHGLGNRLPRAMTIDLTIKVRTATCMVAQAGGIALLSEAAALLFVAEVIVHGPSNPLPTAEIPFHYLHGNVAREGTEFAPIRRPWNGAALRTSGGDRALGSAAGHD